MRVAALVLATAALGAAHAASAGTPRPACSVGAARSAIAQTKPRLALTADRVLIEPAQADRILCFDVTGDGRPDLVVSLASGGTAGDVGWLLFLPQGSRWRLAGAGTGYKLGLARSGRRLEVVQPAYRRNDPNCCPTGGFDRTLYGWAGHGLVVVVAWHTASPR